jgi:dCTP deaminase
MLSGKEIQKLVDSGDIIISPYNEKQLNPNSYNLRLHNELLVYTGHVLDMKKANSFERITIPDDGYVLEPGRLYLGRTVEFTDTPKHIPGIEGRSSVARLGLYVHITAGFGDVGFKGYWTLELHCVQPIKIYPNVAICQIYYNETSKDVELYDSKYQNNTDIQPSMLFKDFE